MKFEDGLITSIDYQIRDHCHEIFFNKYIYLINNNYWWIVLTPSNLPTSLYTHIKHIHITMCLIEKYGLRLIDFKIVIIILLRQKTQVGTIFISKTTFILRTWKNINRHWLTIVWGRLNVLKIFFANYLYVIVL